MCSIAPAEKGAWVVPSLPAMYSGCMSFSFFLFFLFNFYLSLGLSGLHWLISAVATHLLKQILKLNVVLEQWSAEWAVHDSLACELLRLAGHFNVQHSDRINTHTHTYLSKTGGFSVVTGKLWQPQINVDIWKLGAHKCECWLFCVSLSPNWRNLYLIVDIHKVCFVFCWHSCAGICEGLNIHFNG